MLNYNFKKIVDHLTILWSGWSQDDIKTLLSLRARLGHLWCQIYFLKSSLMLAVKQVSMSLKAHRANLPSVSLQCCKIVGTRGRP